MPQTPYAACLCSYLKKEYVCLNGAVYEGHVRYHIVVSAEDRQQRCLETCGGKPILFYTLSYCHIWYLAFFFPIYIYIYIYIYIL